MKPKDLRDEFAMAALDVAAMDIFENYSHGTLHKRTGETLSAAQYIAVISYEIADAMMAERERTNATD